MKNNLTYIILAVMMLASCRKDISDINRNPKAPTDVPGEALFSNAQKSFADTMTTPNVNFNIFNLISQYWAATTYTQESRYDLGNRNIPQRWWTSMYRDVLKDLNESARLIREQQAAAEELRIVQQNKLAIVRIMRVHAYYVLVSTFGNIPYSEALNIEDPTPAYDDQQTVYAALLDTLNESISTLNPAYESFGTADLIYNGDVGKWFRYANSLKLRMAMVIADVDPSRARTLAEEAAPNVFQSNEDNAVFRYVATPPNTNPLWTELVQSNRNDYVPANTMVDLMNTLNDPRRDDYFTTDPGGKYSGGIYGSGNTFANFSHVSDKVLEPDAPGVLMDYAEVEFLLAEAVERGFIAGGTAQEHYNNAVTASILYWGGTQAEATAYLAQPSVSYSSPEWRQKIGTQQWIAMYLRGFDAWVSWRKLDYPDLQAPPSALTALPLRYTYPSNEQNLNEENYAQASQAMGGDAVTTKLFWDVD